MGGGEVNAKTATVRRALVVALISAAMCLTGVVTANATVVGWGGRDVTFTPPVLNGPVNTIIQLKIGANAGKYLIGGSFTNAGGNADMDYVARLNADGTIDNTFANPFTGTNTVAGGGGNCYLGDGTASPSVDVRTLMEVQTTVGTASAGKIYIGGNFKVTNGTNNWNYLLRVNANGGNPNTDFFPTADGKNTGTKSYTSCVYTVFTADDVGGVTTIITGGQQATGMMRKKLITTGADASGFTLPTFSTGGNVVTGFYCTAAMGCPGNRYVIGGNFNSVNSDTKMSHLARLNTNGSLDTSAYPTTDGTASGTALFDDRVNSIALDPDSASASPTPHILVGGQFTDYLALVNLSNFAPLPSYDELTATGFTAPTLNADVWSVAVDSADPGQIDSDHGASYLFSGGFTNAANVPQCDYVCNSNKGGVVGWYFPAPPPTNTVRVATINAYADTNVGKYMIGGAFTDLGGNTATDYVARLNQATPASITINSAGGNNVGGTDGIRTVYSNGQWQVYREGATQLYSPDDDPPIRYQFNQVALALTDGSGGGYIVGPSTLLLSGQYWDTSNRVFRPWDSVTATGGSTGTGTGASDLSVQIDGRTYQVHLALDYTSPNNYIRQTFTVTVPTGNTYNVKLYNLYDSYLGGSDNGPGFYNPVSKIVGVSGQTVYEGLRYVSGQDWAGYMSAEYSDVVFGATELSATHVGPGTGTNLDGSIITDPNNDNGFGVNWDFGSAAGSTTVADDFIFGDITAPTAAPTSAAGEIKVDWTDPSGIAPAPDNYVVTAYDDAGQPTAFTCTAAAPTRTCTVTGLDPAMAYTFLVDFRNGSSTVFNAASTPVHAKREVTLKVWGDPTSVGPAITFSHTLGANPDSYMAAYTGLTAANQAVPSVTAKCPDDSTTTIEASASGQPGEYKAVVGCVDGYEDITSYQAKITVGAGSCLMSAGLPASGSYNVGTTQQTIPTYGTNLPDGTTPAYQAVKDAATLKDFDPTATAGVYLPATRACLPSSPPSTASTTTVAGAIPMTDTAPISNGGSALFSVGDLGNINGYNRVLAEPTNATGTGGGYRTSYSRCGVTNASGTNLNCQLGPPAGVPVTTGGLGGWWNPAMCTGQTIKFRSRYMTQMGYGLWSNESSKVLTGGCN